MILEAARRALADLFSPALRPVLMKTIGLTLAGLIGLWFALDALADWLALPFVDDLVGMLPEWAGWLSAMAAVLVGVALALALALLLGPAAAIVAGLFLDDLAERVEARSYPGDALGSALPLATSIAHSVTFFGVMLVGNLVGLILLLVPGVNLIAFFMINGSLLGREFFEFAAMRFLPPAEAKGLRRRHSGTIFLAGLLVAAMLAVPVLNLFAPFFGAALMIHLHKLITSDTRAAMVAAPRHASAAGTPG